MYPCKTLNVRYMYVVSLRILRRDAATLEDIEPVQTVKPAIDRHRAKIERGREEASSVKDSSNLYSAVIKYC